MSRLLIALAALASLSGCVGWGADVQYWRPDLDASLRVSDGGIPGDLVNLQRNLDVDRDEDVPVECFWFQVGPSRYELGHWAMSAAGYGNPNISFNFGGSAYAVTDEVDSQFDVDVWRLAYLFSPKLGKFKIGIGGALQWWDVEAVLENVTQGFTEDFDESYPIPAITARLEVPIGLFVSAFAETDWIDAEIGDIEGSFTDIRAGVRVAAPKGFSAMAGYRIVTADVEVDGDTADFEFDGVVFSLAVGF